MNKVLMTGLMFVLSKLMQGVGYYQGASDDGAKLNLASVYAHVGKITRLLWIALLGSGVCLILIFMGLALIHHTILVYAPWDVSLKVTITLICAILYLAIAVGVFVYVFAEDKWVKMFNLEAMNKELSGKL